MEDIEALETYVRPVRDTFIDLFHHTAEWYTSYPDKDLDFALDVMESFDRCVGLAFGFLYVARLITARASVE